MTFTPLAAFARQHPAGGTPPEEVTRSGVSPAACHTTTTRGALIA